jgi:hypothetical protein
MSRRIVNEKQQLTNPSSFFSFLCPVPDRDLRCETGVLYPDEGRLMKGLYRSTQEVRTAFCVESKATWPYFWIKLHEHLSGSLANEEGKVK